MLCVFYRRLEFGLTVREPSHYLNASRAPMPGVPSFSGVLSREHVHVERLRYHVRSAILGGSGRRSCYLGAVLGGTVGESWESWEALEAAVLPGSVLVGGLCVLAYLFCYQSAACLPLFVPADYLPPLLPGYYLGALVATWVVSLGSWVGSWLPL